jgi:ADP-heptose:LPS heptosyltransferase
MPAKILIVRFSSFGDVTQCLSVPTKLVERFPGAEIHWATKVEYVQLLEGHPHVHRVWPLPSKAGMAELASMCAALKRERFSHLYDAHRNIRSLILATWLKLHNWQLKTLSKPRKRWKRLLLFRFRMNRYKLPFSGQRDLLEPLAEWGVSEALPPAPQLFLTGDDLGAVRGLVPSAPFVALGPSAAFPLKRWPLEHWQSLVAQSGTTRFVLLGGPDDHFLAEIQRVAPERVVNLAGKTTLRQSCAVIKLSELLIVNDTGLLHAAEQLSHPTIALMGPAPFGFPSRASTQVLERTLACRPCSKHGASACVNPTFHECLRAILPEEVHEQMRGILAAHRGSWTHRTVSRRRPVRSG